MIHHAVFKRPLENILLAAARNDVFVQSRIRERSKVSLLTKGDGTKLLNESVRLGYGRVVQAATTTSEKVRPPNKHGTTVEFPKDLLATFSTFADHMHRILTTLHDSTPDEAVTSVVNQVIELLPESAKQALSIDWNAMARSFDDLFKSKAIKPSHKLKFTGHLSVNVERLHTFLRITTVGYLNAPAKANEARVLVVSLNQLPPSLRATRVILRDSPRLRGLIGPYVGKSLDSFPSSFAFDMSTAARLWAFDFLRCANIATDQVVLIPNASDVSVFEFASKAGIQVNPKSGEWYAALAALSPSPPQATRRNPTHPIPIFAQTKVISWADFLSFTHIRYFLACPLSVRRFAPLMSRVSSSYRFLQYFYRYRLAATSRLSAATAVGSALHAIVAKVQERHQKEKGKQLTSSEIKEHVEAEVKSALVTQLSKSAPRMEDSEPEDVAAVVEQATELPDVQALIKRAEKAVDQFQKQEESASANKTTSAEQPFRFWVDDIQIRGTCGHTDHFEKFNILKRVSLVSGNWDRVEVDETTGEVTIVEFKSAMRNTRPLDFLQLKIYCLVCKLIKAEVYGTG